MGITLMPLCCHKYRQTFICLIILFASSSFSIFSSHFVFTAEGRAISNLIEVPHQKELKEGESIMVKKTQIGSRPPKCEGRCRNCGHCEAVQVPVVPQVIRSHYYSSTRTTIAVTSSRGEDLSNYKPMSWKCKCGDYFFNP